MFLVEWLHNFDFSNNLPFMIYVVFGFILHGLAVKADNKNPTKNKDMMSYTDWFWMVYVPILGIYISMINKNER